ncbi:MAG: Transcriptional regulator, GntR family domain / Aspartate aminotransferase (EC [uncultured Paraburkholderia sp.]|uniref:aminotransferase-like domain-containing protein n=1 Tax=uncultured Paraburkholderia sp. TaxID=1822466 RepID=UPI0025951CF4|nr:PLP-dependent aminotransferase family protein [uncultured Paraburkholderia sp.]CAH2893184.1 MAG: Transcriptional regulator, GntR family domain / Aspartate aminotransferase (EC [uncultured Paraburkholderia sp.]CAH2908269.1 MAG: Transcriptional regulator, GntR family domain / Aspartate aminotransferase (EC [uncultured Paraburkholderia sp.]
MKLYEKLADEITEAVRRGVFAAGERIPSVRQASQQHGVSIKTVLHAYALLESRGIVETRPQSGYFVREAALHAFRPETRRVGGKPAALVAPVAAEVDVSRLVLSTLRSIRAHDAIPFGSPYPDPSLFPWRRVNQYANAIARRQASWNLIDDLPPGNPELIRQIARRYTENGMPVDPDEIVITLGATEAINLSLQAVAKPGDTVAVESPTYYAMLHAIERLGMRAIEVATHPVDGIDIDALAQVIERQKIAACMVMPNFQNPLGFQMPDARKRQLVELLAAHQIPVIENDVYQELYFGETRPSALKSFDTQGLVLHCASFSKSLTASYRIGWALPGRYRAQVEKLKFLNTLTTPSVPQVAVADYLRQDAYDRHLRHVRKVYRQQASIMTALVRRFFPAGTRISTPQGGYVLWVELPERVDSMRLYQAALARSITVGPGMMFSTRNDFRHFIRLNYSYPWTAQTEAALKTLGELVTQMA